MQFLIIFNDNTDKIPIQKADELIKQSMAWHGRLLQNEIDEQRRILEAAKVALEERKKEVSEWLSIVKVFMSYRWSRCGSTPSEYETRQHNRSKLSRQKRSHLRSRRNE